MIPLPQALAILDKAVKQFSLPSEQILVADSLQRVVAENQYSLLNLPPFDKSAMDGYAILAGDESKSYRLLEVVAAGELPQQKLSIGTTVKIMTGAKVPAGSGMVVPVEMAQERDGAVKIITKPLTSNICRFGEDVKKGDSILVAGNVLRAEQIANLVACGITKVKVYRKPRVAIISTGDEIVDSPEKIIEGKIMNSNGPMLQALCQQNGLEVLKQMVVIDDYDLTVETVKRALDLADIVLLSGGVSAGDFDFVTSALKEANLTTYFNRVAVKPGKPITFAANENKIVFGLPGNPVSVYFTFYLFVLRALRGIFGAPSEDNYLTLPLAKDFKRIQTDRTEYVPCRLLKDGSLEPLKFHGSAHLAVLLECNGFFVVEKNITHVAVGEKVKVFMLNK